MMDEKYFGVGGCFVVTRKNRNVELLLGFSLKPLVREGLAPLLILIPRVL